MVKPPEVFVVGSSRAGTSTLRTYLAQHPDLFVPRILEPRYHAADTREALRGPADKVMAAGMTASWRKYLDLYRWRTSQQRGVEVTPAYLSSQLAADSIWRTAPQAKIIAILRHPVERAFSSFRLERLDGTEPESSFGRALALETERREAGWGYVWRYRERGLYGRQLAQYYRIFAPSQILVMLYDDWQRDQGRHLVATVFEFLGINPPVLTGPTRIENSASPEQFRARGLAVPYLDLVTAEGLLDSYQADFNTLEALIGRDLSAWRKWRPAVLDGRPPGGGPERPCR